MTFDPRPMPPALRNCPRCHTPVDWQHSDTAFNATAEYRICPHCDEAVFQSWRSARADTPQRVAGAPC